jgi:hypothetical protein
MEWDFDHWYHYVWTGELRWTKSNPISDTDAHTDEQCIAAARRYDGTVGNDAVNYSINTNGRGERQINKFVYSAVDAQTYGVQGVTHGHNGTCFDAVQDWYDAQYGPGCAYLGG